MLSRLYLWLRCIPIVVQGKRMGEHVVVELARCCVLFDRVICWLCMNMFDAVVYVLLTRC